MAVLLHWSVVSQRSFDYREVHSSFRTSTLFVSDLNLQGIFVCSHSDLSFLGSNGLVSLHDTLILPDEALHDESSRECEEEGGEVEGEPAGEVLKETVVGEEYEAH